MKRPRRPFIPQRRRVFFGCEGDSERGYGGLIGRLLEEQRRDIHLDVTLLKPGGGDPLALVERAIKYIRDSERKWEAPYALRVQATWKPYSLIACSTAGAGGARRRAFPGC
jgi:hypothetical protein